MRFFTLICSLCMICLLIGPSDTQAQLSKLKKKAQQARSKVEHSASKASSAASDQSSPQEQSSQATPGSSASVVDLYVSPGGSNRNDGSRSSPMKNIDKALEKAPAGARIHVAEGVYTGTFGVGYWEIHRPVELYGGYSADFSTRDPFTHLTLLQPPADVFDKSGPRNVMEVMKPINGVVVDGFIFEGGIKTPYHTDKGRPEGVETGRMKWEPKSKNPEGIMLVLNGNNQAARNNAFINSSFGGVSARIGQAGDGDIEIANNIFVSNRMSSIQGFGRKNSNGGTIDIHHNTIVFSWSRTHDFGSLGYGIDVQDSATFKIHENLIALSISAAIFSQRFNTNLYIDDNLFFGNKHHDFFFAPASNVYVEIDAPEFEDLDLPSVSGNVNRHTALPLDEAYLDGFLNAQYTEQTDYDANSHANLLREINGLNKRGFIEHQVTMYANRYPWQKALELFGAVPDYGAQRRVFGANAQ